MALESFQGQWNVEDRMEDEAAEMVSRRGAAGSDRDLGSRLREARHILQDRRWRPAGTDACLARNSKTGMRMENWVRRSVQISLGVAVGRGGRYT